MGFIDFHAHLSLKAGSEMSLLEVMDRLGIERSVVVGGGLVDPKQIANGIEGKTPQDRALIHFDNQALLKKCAPYSTRLKPFYFANPWLEPIEYIESGHGFFGLKLAPAIHGLALADERQLAWYAAAKIFDHPVYLHCLNQDGFRVSDLVTAAKNFPEIIFVLGHAGIGNLDFNAINEIEDQLNIFYETSGGFSAVIYQAVKTLGAHRILFGSEFPLQDPEAELIKIRNLALTPTELQMISRENSANLIDGINNVS